MGDEYGLSMTAELGLSMTVELPTEEDLQESVTLGLSVTVEVSAVESIYEVEEVGLRLQFSFMVTPEERHIDLSWYWDPPGILYQTVNYTYYCTLMENGTAVNNAEVHVVFDGFYLLDKTSNATGQFNYWAVVNSAGVHEWSFIIYQDNVLVYMIYEELDYMEWGGPDPDEPGPPDPLGPLPTEPGSLFGVFTFLPLMTVFGLFGFIGMLLIGRVGILFGGVAALFLTTAMGNMPIWVLFFLILVTILVVVYKLKMGGPKVEVSGA